MPDELPSLPDELPSLPDELPSLPDSLPGSQWERVQRKKRLPVVVFWAACSINCSERETKTKKGVEIVRCHELKLFETEVRFVRLFRVFKIKVFI